ncbi:AAA family ATPase [Acetivibrio ethanolgignens]|uniref:Cytidylate kinase n=1 Tax=Acetivibrio ethanolgignens TaxID=290052 RepID=A0A0V8QIF1_9FIRM|nr:cytidylate kinase-like family protein [Acetivibrio ethanolgignens]KSV60337.1 cytidylate kinase [Acetivibrio ethanolgignens]
MEKIVITIARSYGSGGKTLGELLAKDLGIPCYDRELIRMASDESGINEALFGKADEKKKGRSLFKSIKPYSGGVLPPESSDFVSDDNLFNLQAKIIKDLAEKESCIIIGRCADYVLKDRKDVLRLYFYATEEDCLIRLKNISGEPEKELLKKIHTIDKHRADYYKYYTGNDWNDTRNYDFCLNTGAMSYEKLIDVVKAYIEISRR